MIAASIRQSQRDEAIQCRLDRREALQAELEQIWARERAELEDLAQRYAGQPWKGMMRRAQVILRHWSQERKIHDELTRLCGFVRLGD
jgi:hypothetical protein